MLPKPLQYLSTMWPVWVDEKAPANQSITDRALSLRENSVGFGRAVACNNQQCDPLRVGFGGGGVHLSCQCQSCPQLQLLKKYRNLSKMCFPRPVLYCEFQFLRHAFNFGTSAAFIKLIPVKGCSDWLFMQATSQTSTIQGHCLKRFVVVHFTTWVREE